MKTQLKQANFTEIREVDKWMLEPGKSYYFTRNASTIVAFHVGSKCADGVNLFKMIGCHTDSPVIKLAPCNKLANKCGYQQMNV
jgi:aspartyl aminopeptidase